MRILLTDYAWPDLDVETQLIEQAGHELLVSDSTEEDRLVALAADADAIMTTWASVTEAVIDACTNCKTVTRLGIGLDNIAVQHCTQKGIPVTNVPSYCVDEVAEHALALLLSLARNITFFDRQIKAGVYSLTDAGPMRRIAGQTLGIVGFGKTGRALASRALAMGLKVLVANRSPITSELDVEQVELERLLSDSDMVSVHLPLTEQTHHLFDENRLKQMKKGALLVNTSRGGLIDPTALWEVVKSGHLGGVGLDVYEPEPPDLSAPLYRHDRVLCTPHAAFNSNESLEILRRTAVEQTLQILAGGVPDNLVNPEVLGS